jgi:CRP-like cAMP-binding protein
MTEVARQRSRSALRAEAGVADALANVSVFSMCTKRQLRLVAKLAKVNTVAPGTKILVQGESGDALFVLLSGRADVSRSGRKVASIGTGAVIGELAAIVKAPRNATVTTRTECEIATIKHRALHRLIEDVPGFARKLLEAMAHRVRELDRRIVA